MLRDAIVVGCYLFSLNMAVCFFFSSQSYCEENQQSNVYGMLADRLVRACPQISLVRLAREKALEKVISLYQKSYWIAELMFSLAVFSGLARC